MARPRTAVYQFAKRCLDLMVSIPALVFAAPILAWALLRNLHTRNVLHRVVLFGRNLVQFTSFTSESAAVRRALRLCDVARGKASLVGPRLVNTREAQCEALAVRSFVTPGLVCLHWLRTRSNVAYLPEAVNDREYVEKRSFWMDMSIVARAAVVSLYGKPAADASRSVQILGVNIDNVSLEDAVHAIEAATDHAGRGVQVAFVNSDCLNKAHRNAAYKRVLNNSSLVLADGIGVKIAGSMLGRPIKQNVNGTDLFPTLCERLAQRQGKLFLLGARPEVVSALAERVTRQYRGINVCGAIPGYFDDEQSVVQQIADAAPDVLLVAMGAPQQELFIARNRSTLNAKVCIGVGGLFDFYSGRIPRAPQWLREIGMEWTYRLYQEPGRLWRRYLVGNFTFILRVFAEKLRITEKASGKVTAA